MQLKSPAKKAIIIGFDGASMELIKHLVSEGHMPQVAKLMEAGVHREMLGVLPTLTPPGWTTLMTGAWPGTHGITDFHIRKPGASLAESQWGINTDLCKAEYLWNTAERCGKTPILVKWEMAWPPTVTKGIQVEGTGPGVSNYCQIAGYHFFATRDYEGYQVGGEKDVEGVDPSALTSSDIIDWVAPKPARKWKNLPESQNPPLEVELHIHPLARGQPSMLRGKVGSPKTYHALLYAQGDQGYDSVIVAPSKDAGNAFAALARSQWSTWWRDSFIIDGEPVDCSVRCKLINLSADGQHLELFFPQIWPITGYTYPDGVAQEIYDKVGPFLQNPARDALGLIDDDTYFELLEYHHECLAETALFLMDDHDWDLLFTETHASDYASHFFLRLADETSGAEPHIRDRCYAGVLRTYQSIDRWVGRLMSRADDGTIVAILSDHGGTPDKYRRVSVEEALVQAGLLVSETDEKTGQQIVNWSETRAAPLGLCDVFINLKGREPDGIVAAEDYAVVQREIIDAILDFKDSATGQRTFTLALTRQDAEMLNAWGELEGDVVYALRPEFDGAHGFHLPTSRLGIGGQHAVFIMAGAGVKNGVHLNGQVRQVDVAPTISYLLGFDVPRDAEGGVVYEALEDPNWHLAALF